MTALIDLTRRDTEQLIGALCTDSQTDPDLWFPDGKTGPVARFQIQAAKEVCELCPVQVACLEQARARGERHGVWGGHDFEVEDPKRCGTKAGHKRHIDRKEPTCQPCRDAKAVDDRRRRQEAKHRKVQP